MAGTGDTFEQGNAAEMHLSQRHVMTMIGLLLVASVFVAVWRPAIPAIERPRAFPAEQITRGAELAAIGDCSVCHADAGGGAYAGGRGVPTPFGTVYATNITPDVETGIGQWSGEAFRRAMRDGIDRAGRHLYPVLPYPHFTRASDADIAALYAFLMTRAPVRATATADQLAFPFNQRFLLAFWNMLFLRPGPWQPDAAHDVNWNRGAYLVEAIGHCGACHSPRNALGAERSSGALGGGEAEGWYAPPLQSASPAGSAWTEAELARYLRTGFDANHGAAAGPMTAVTDALGRVSDSDVRAMVGYIASLMPKVATGSAPVVVARGQTADPLVAAMFTGACGGCHAADAPMTRNGAPSLALGTAVNAPTPQGVIQIILHGIPWRGEQGGPYMPPFGSILTDAQVADLAGYLRATYSDKPAWTDVPAAVAKVRRAS
jgi:mono/diheme cytochrome c family protein